VGDINGSDEVAKTTPPDGPEAPGAGCKSTPGANGDAEAVADNKVSPIAAVRINRVGRISVCSPLRIARMLLE
jgi:hypothetical protein